MQQGTCNGGVIAQVRRDSRGDQRVGAIHEAARGRHEEGVPAQRQVAKGAVQEHGGQGHSDKGGRDGRCSPTLV